MIERLRTAPFELIGRFTDASNATLLARLTDRDPRHLDELGNRPGDLPEIDDLDPADLAVHKPEHGEAPLWDFPSGTLSRREVAAYEVSCALGWDLVPETVFRDDGPLGPGSLQRYVPHDPDFHYFTLLESADAEVVAQLRAMVVFDLVIDNADRKGGHVLLEQADEGPARIRLVDHGVSFHVERKLRTVAWEFAGEPVPRRLAGDVARLSDAVDGALGHRLASLLAQDEIAALAARSRTVAAMDVFPEPSGHSPYPWPLL